MIEVNSSAAHPSDTLLMRRVAQRDPRAFEAVYDRYRSQAFGLAMRITGRPGAAEEVIQDVFLNLWRSAAHWDPGRAGLDTWLLSMVRYRSIDVLRRAGRRSRDTPLDQLRGARLEAPERTEDEVVAREEAQHARRLLKSLPAEQREVLELAYFGGQTLAEIAAGTGAPLGTVKGRARLALEKLRSSRSTAAFFARAG